MSRKRPFEPVVRHPGERMAPADDCNTGRRRRVATGFANSIHARRSVMRLASPRRAIDRAIGRRNLGSFAPRRFGSGDRGAWTARRIDPHISPAACMTARAGRRVVAGDLSSR